MYTLALRVVEFLRRQRPARSLGLFAEPRKRWSKPCAPLTENQTRVVEPLRCQHVEHSRTLAGIHHRRPCAPCATSIRNADNVQHLHESLFVTGVQRPSAGPEVDAAPGDPQQLTELLPGQTGDSTQFGDGSGRDARGARQGWRGAGRSDHVPQTVIRLPRYAWASRKTRSSQLLPSRMSKITRCPESAPLVSM